MRFTKMILKKVNNSTVKELVRKGQIYGIIFKQIVKQVKMYMIQEI